MNKLKINDKVSWRGSFGSDAPKTAKVIGIELTKGGKYGEPVDEVDWKLVTDRNITVDLDNGHWAYASQIKRIN